MRSLKVLALLILASAVSACGVFSSSEERTPFEARPTVMGVNGYLWQATLDTLNFMSLASAEQSNGIILTDWMISPQNPNERVKLTVRFLSNELRSDAVRVVISREERINDSWVVADSQATTALQIEEAILTQARRLRIEADG